MTSAQIEKRFGQAEAAFRRTQVRRADGESIVAFAARVRNQDMNAARIAADKFSRVTRRCGRLIIAARKAGI